MLLVVTAAAEEADAVLAHTDRSTVVHLGPYPARRTALACVVAGGIGPAAAAAAAATALALDSYTGVLSVGIAGGFGLEPGRLVVASSIVPADLGSWSPEGWLGAADLGWPEQQAVATHEPDRLAALIGAACGPVLTLSAMTGTDERAAELARRHGALAEAMEGAGVAAAAAPYGLPITEIRAISNLAGRRDRAGWDIAGALASLSGALRDVLSAWP